MTEAGARIAVITPYFREAPEMLRQCHESVSTQDMAADHFMIADGHPLAEIDAWPVRHVKLPQAHGDNGNTPRGLGALLAQSEGYDFIAFLDADNWYHPGHLPSLIEAHRQSGAPVCASFRTFHDASGVALDVEEGDENALGHIDTSCFLLARPAFAALTLWLTMPKVLSPVSDRVFLAGLLHQRHAIRSTGERTVAFRSQYAFHYRQAGLPPPPEAKTADEFKAAREFLQSSQGVTACVAAMGFWPPSYVATL